MIGTLARTAGLAYAIGAYSAMVGAATAYQTAARLGLTHHECNLALAEKLADTGFRFLDQSHDRIAGLKNRLRYF